MTQNNTGYKGLVPDLKEGLYRLRNEVTSEVEFENYEEIGKENLSARESEVMNEEVVKTKRND